MKRFYSVVLCFAVMAVVGCAGATKSAPHVGFASLNLNTSMARSDIVVLGSVEGKSTATDIFFGVVTIVDGDKYKVFGIPIGFTDKYAYRQSPSLMNPGSLLSLLGPSAGDRAYYKALEQAPDADAVFVKSEDTEKSGIPIIYSTKTVTWRGKAIRIKEDK